MQPAWVARAATAQRTTTATTEVTRLMSGYESPRQESTGITNSDRQQMLLDDLRAEIARLADAVERQNELLNKSDESGGEAEP